MTTRRVTVCIYEYPKDYLSSFSIRHLLEIDEDLIFHDKYLSERPLCELMQRHINHVQDYAGMLEEEHCFRIVVRDSDSRLSLSFRA